MDTLKENPRSSTIHGWYSFMFCHIGKTIEELTASLISYYQSLMRKADYYIKQEKHVEHTIVASAILCVLHMEWWYKLTAICIHTTSEEPQCKGLCGICM
jgi:hypothetical protein